MLEFGVLEWLIAGSCAVLVGFSKTGVPGAGILVVPMLAQIMPARESTGFLLPMLCAADVMAVIYWHRRVQWGKLTRLMPWTLGGLAIGYVGLSWISNELLMPVIGVIVLLLLALTTWRNWGKGSQKQIPSYWWFAGVMGLLAGTTTMLANAAGPIMTIYLLSMRLKKEEFIGTGAVFFWVVNLLKLPLSGSLGLISSQSLLTNLALVPLIVAGGIAGIKLVHRIPERPFKVVVTVLAVATAVGLCLRALV